MASIRSSNSPSRREHAVELFGEVSRESLRRVDVKSAYKHSRVCYHYSSCAAVFASGRTNCDTHESPYVSMSVLFISHVCALHQRHRVVGITIYVVTGIISVSPTYLLRSVFLVTHTYGVRATCNT